METLDGKSPAPIKISIASQKIEFNLDLNSLRETSGSTSLSFSANQKMDIFNTLLSIKQNLESGNLPTDAQISSLNDFNKHILDKTSAVGNIINQLSATSDVLNSQKLTLQGLLSSEQDVDMARATVDLQAQDYSLQLSYKIASMILPKSLLDFL
jgi:flagellar hook-associated protein 3 FlgL